MIIDLHIYTHLQIDAFLWHVACFNLSRAILIKITELQKEKISVLQNSKTVYRSKKVV
jgi:hypothetical protein